MINILNVRLYLSKINYVNFLLIRKEMFLKANISTTTLAKMGKNETVSMDVLLRICNVLDCNVGDIMDVTKN